MGTSISSKVAPSLLSELLQAVALGDEITSAALSKKRNSRSILGPVSILQKKEESTPSSLCHSISYQTVQFSLSHSARSFHLNFASPQSLQTPPTISSLNVSNFRSANLASDASMNNSSQESGW